MLKLTLVAESTSADPGQKRSEQFITAANPTDLLEKWRTTPSRSGFGWGNYDPQNFRARLISFSGAEGVTDQSEDDEILDAVVRAFGPSVVKLTKNYHPGLRGRV